MGAPMNDDTATWEEIIRLDVRLMGLLAAARAVVNCEHFGEWGHRLDALRAAIRECETPPTQRGADR